MVTFNTADGRKIEVSVLDAIFGGGRTIRQPKRKAAVPARPTRAEVTNKAEEAKAEEKKAEEAKAEEKKSEVLAIEATKPRDKATEWTAEEDAILIGMKAENKSWKEIHAALKGKPLIKDRYKQLVKDKEDEEAKAKEEAEKKEAKIAEHKKRKEEKGKAWKEKEAKEKEAKEKEAKEKEAKEKEAKEKEAKEKKVEERKAEERGKKGKGKEREAEKSTHNKRPIVYLDEAGGLNFKEMMLLYKLHERHESEKWTGIASRFYDKTGKRLDMENLPFMIRDRFGILNA